MSSLRTYRTTAVLTAANAAVYIAAWAQGADIAPLSLPGDLADALARPWALLTYMFSHVHPWHLALNLIVLIVAGALYEYRRGHAAMLATYLTGGIAGGVIFIAAATVAGSTQATLMGASAAALAVCAAIPASIREIGPLLRTPAAIIGIVFSISLILWGLFGQNPGGNIAHLAGIAAGIACGLFTRSAKPTAIDNSDIINKAHTSGFASLTDDERKRLARTYQSKN